VGLREPGWAAFTAGGQTWLELRWTARSAFQTAMQEAMAGGEVRVWSNPAMPPSTPPLRAVLRHETFLLEVPVSVGTPSPGSLGYRLVLDANARASIAAHLAI
jgi:hypothetical protein